MDVTARVERDLLDLLAIPSEGGSAAEAQAQQWAAERFASVGCQVRTWTTATADLVARPGYPGQEVGRESVTGMLATIAGTGTGCVLLVGHTDVVPAAGWDLAFAPVAHRDRVVGRGAADMKGGVIAMLQVARALQDRSADRTVLFATVSGEEDGGVGAFDLVWELADLGVEPDGALIPEPTDGCVVVANAGALGFELTLTGRSAHAAIRWEGVDTLDLISAVHHATRELERDFSLLADPLLHDWPIPHPISIGTVVGGDWASTVMAGATLAGRLGVPLEMSVAEARRRFEQVVSGAVASVSEQAAVTITWSGGQFVPARQSPGHPVVRRLVAAHESVFGVMPVVTGTTYGSDLRLLLGAGIPTVVYGPGRTEQAHARDESVRIQDVLARADVIHRWALARDA